VQRSEQRARHRCVRVGVAAESHDEPQAVLEGGGLRGHLQRDPGREERETHIRPVDRAGSPRLGDQVLELLPSLEVEHGPDGLLGRRPRIYPPNQRGGRERHRQAGTPAALVPVRDGRERGRLIEEQLRARRSEGSERRAVHHGAVAGRDLRSSPGDVPLRRIRDTVPDAAQDAPREDPDIRRLAGQPIEMPPHEITRLQPSVLGQGSTEVARQRRVVGPVPGLEPHPTPLEHGQRIGDVLTPTELERRPECVPEGKPEDASDHPFPLVMHREGAYRR
jgi:hypothetical protein